MIDATTSAKAVSDAVIGTVVGTSSLTADSIDMQCIFLVSSPLVGEG